MLKPVPPPPSSSCRSKTTGSRPRLTRASASASPPTPPPAIRTLLAAGIRPPASIVPIGSPARVELPPVLRQRVDPPPLLVRKLEVEHLEVRNPVLVAGSLRDRSHAILFDQPAQRHLSGRLAVRLADLGQHRLPVDLAVRERCVGRDHEVMLAGDIQQPVLTQHRVVFDLVAQKRGGLERAPEHPGGE